MYRLMVELFPFGGVAFVTSGPEEVGSSDATRRSQRSRLLATAAAAPAAAPAAAATAAATAAAAAATAAAPAAAAAVRAAVRASVGAAVATTNTTRIAARRSLAATAKVSE